LNSKTINSASYRILPDILHSYDKKTMQLCRESLLQLNQEK